MRLYATTTSDKGKHAGKGGNNFLEICLEIEHDNKKREVFGTLFLRREKDGRAIHAEECFVLDYEGGEIDRMVVEK